jgi:hypothetical protein
MSLMTQTLIFDRQRYTDKLRDNGIDEKAARAHGDALDGALREAVATKADVQLVKADMLTEFAKVRVELAALKTEIGDVRLELKHDLAALETRFDARLDTSIANLHRDLTASMATKQTELIKWMIGSQIGLLVAIMTLIKLFKV